MSTLPSLSWVSRSSVSATGIYLPAKTSEKRSGLTHPSLQELAWRLSPDNVIAGTEREYGHADLKAHRYDDHVDRLFSGLEDDMTVWMSHGDKLSKLPEGFHIIATTNNSPYAGIAHKSKPVGEFSLDPVSQPRLFTNSNQQYVLISCETKKKDK